MRTKFEQPRIPSKLEMRFIGYISGTGDGYGLSERTLSLFLNVSARKLRMFKERYNNLKYLDITVKGKIHNIKGLYKLVRPSSKYCTRYIMQTNFNLICSAIDKRNTAKILGELQHKNQLSLDDVSLMSLDELIAQAKSYEEKLKEVE